MTFTLSAIMTIVAGKVICLPVPLIISVPTTSYIFAPDAFAVIDVIVNLPVGYCVTSKKSALDKCQTSFALSSPERSVDVIVDISIVNSPAATMPLSRVTKPSLSAMVP